ncbi:MAG: glycosyltransferase family 2 protein [Magnetococcales bacterium]|nr:glycosyltransferase family 2 protein [Magnetococcales bacterium]
MPPHPISVVIITLNAADQLPGCLESVPFADEILIVDSGSTDQTGQIAEKFGARVLKQSWLGFGPQKQFAVAQAKNPWVLCLDADEAVDETLAASLQKEIENPGYLAYRMARRNRFMGRWLGHGEGYPDEKLRFFHRDHAQWSREPVHEEVVTEKAVGRLQGEIRHRSEEGLESYLAKQNRYTTVQAEALVASGKKISPRHLLLSPPARFIKFYILRRGVLDGLPGFVHCMIGAFSSFLKYAKALSLVREKTG